MQSPPPPERSAAQLDLAYTLLDLMQQQRHSKVHQRRQLYQSWF